MSVAIRVKGSLITGNGCRGALAVMAGPAFWHTGKRHTFHSRPLLSPANQLSLRSYVRFSPSQNVLR